MKPKMPEMKAVQEASFGLWIGSLVCFSVLAVYQNFQEVPWKDPFSWQISLVVIGIGVITFVLNSLLGIILRICKKEHFKFGLISLPIALVWSVLFIGGMLAWSPATRKLEKQNAIIAAEALNAVSPIPISTPSATVKPKPKVTQDPYKNDPNLKDAKWGEAVKVREHEYTMKVGRDATMGSSQEIFEAVNNYRSVKGVGRLEWNEKIAALARERVLELPSDKTPHEGYYRRIHEDGFYDEYGVNGVGENASLGYRLSGVHLIEWLYASDAGHESNQLNPRWNCVGIATSGDSSVLMFCNK